MPIPLPCCLQPEEAGMRGFDEFAKKYRAGLAKAPGAVDLLPPGGQQPVEFGLRHLREDILDHLGHFFFSDAHPVGRGVVHRNAGSSCAGTEPVAEPEQAAVVNRADVAALQLERFPLRWPEPVIYEILKWAGRETLQS